MLQPWQPSKEVPKHQPETVGPEARKNLQQAGRAASVGVASWEGDAWKQKPVKNCAFH